VCVLGISDLTTASAFDVAVGMEHGRMSARVCVDNTNDKVWSSVNPRVSSICRCTLKALACSVCVELRVAGRLDSFRQMFCDC